MRLRGRLKGLSRDLLTGKSLVTFEVNELPEGISSLPEDLSIEATAYRNKRSLNANAYYWVLVGKIAARLGISNSEAHNRLLMRYGALELFGEQLVYVSLPDTEEAERKALESEYFHVRPTSHTKGHTRFWVMIKGSHEYNTEEFSRLLNGAIDEAKELGIETLPPDEIERMMASYALNYSNRR